MSITDRARAEAETRPTDEAPSRDRIVYVSAFMDGARWAASLPPTDEEVEAACRGFYNDPNGLTDWDKLARVEPDLADKYRAGMRRSLTAAREAQR